MSTVFSKIIQKKLPAEIILENEHCIVIKDIAPQAPVHLLIIPKKEISNLQGMKKEDFFLLQEIGKIAQELALSFGIEKGYRLLTNVGEDAGQTVFHLHFHLLGGDKLRHLV